MKNRILINCFSSFVFFAAFSLFIFHVEATEPLRLQSFIQQVTEANPNLQAAKLRAEAFQFRIKPAGSLEDPVFAVGPDDIPFRDGMGSVIRYQINQTLPFPTKPLLRSKIARSRSQSAEADTETTRRQLVVFSTQIFYKAYLNQESLRFNADAQKLVGALIETGKSRYITGGSTHHEWLLARAELGVLKTEQLKLLREKIGLQALLNELRNQDPATPLGTLIADFSSQKTLEAPDPAILLENQPERKSLQHQTEAARRERDLAKAGYFPDFMAQGMITQRRGMEEPSGWGFMVGVNLPVFAYRKQANLVKAAEKEREVTLSEQQSLENRLKTEITEAKQQFFTARDLIRLYQGSVIPETELALKSSLSAYITGNASLSSVLNLSRIRLTQRLELLSAKIDLELAHLRMRELLSSPPLQRFAPSSPTLFFAEPMGSMGGKNMPMGNSGAGMGKGMSGPAGRPQKMGQEGKGDEGGGMGGMK